MKHIFNYCTVKYIREIPIKVAGEVENLENKKDPYQNTALPLTTILSSLIVKKQYSFGPLRKLLGPTTMDDKHHQ